MKIVAIVPMKLNNKRLPSKNTKSFSNGSPLCSYILNTLNKIEMISETYVYCSNPGIIQYLPPKIKYLKRPESFDADTTKMNEILLAFAREIPADIYVLAHTTAPFITPSSIETGLNQVLSGKYDSAFAATRLQEFIWKDGKPLNYQLEEIPRTQDLPALFCETSSFYIYKSSIILNSRRRIGEAPYIVEIGKIEGIDIDEEEDFIMADAIYNYYLSKCGGGGGEITP